MQGLLGMYQDLENPDFGNLPKKNVNKPKVQSKVYNQKPAVTQKKKEL